MATASSPAHAPSLPRTIAPVSAGGGSTWSRCSNTANTGATRCSDAASCTNGSQEVLMADEPVSEQGEVDGHDDLQRQILARSAGLQRQLLGILNDPVEQWVGQPMIAAH